MRAYFFLFKNSKKERKFVFSLYDVQAPSKLKLEYEGITFESDVREEFVRNGDRQEFADFFDNPSTIFARVVIEAGDEASSLTKSLFEVSKAVNFFNVCLHADAKINKTDYVYWDGGWYRQSKMAKPIHSDTGTKSFELTKIPLEVRTENSPLVRRIIASDNIYFQGRSSIQREERLVNLWRYFESFFDEADYRSEDIKRNVAKLLSKAGEVTFDFMALKYATDVLYAHYSDSRIDHIDSSREELWKLMHPELIINANYKRMNQLLNHPFINRKLNEQESLTVEMKRQVIEQFYLRTLDEAYEQRNLIEHCGSFNEKSVDKVLIVLPDMAKEFRRIIVSSTLSKKVKSIYEVI